MTLGLRGHSLSPRTGHDNRQRRRGVCASCGYSVVVNQLLQGQYANSFFLFFNSLIWKKDVTDSSHTVVVLCIIHLIHVSVSMLCNSLVCHDMNSLKCSTVTNVTICNSSKLNHALNISIRISHPVKFLSSSLSRKKKKSLEEKNFINIQGHTGNL